MGIKNLGTSTASDLTNTITDYEVKPTETDGQTGSETSYINQDWTKQWGYYKFTPKLKADINIKCSWIVGKGYIADPETEIILDTIRGIGKDSFNSIMENMERIKHIGGDAFAEIILDEDDNLINLKPLNPGSMKIVADKTGMIIRYEQMGGVGRPKSFKPGQIFHLMRNRGADEIHGDSIVPAIEPIIKSIEEVMGDWRKVMHWNVRPRWLIKLDTDVQSEIDTFKAKYDAANAKGENFYIPMGAVEVEVLGVAPNATLNPLAWIDLLTQHFHQATGVPDIVGGGGTVSLTDASSKIKYLAFEQTIREEQKYLEEQILLQLNYEVSFPMPALLENDMVSGTPNEEGAGSIAAPEEEPVQGMEENDTTAEVEGNT